MTKPPTNYTEFLTIAKTANIVDWHRDSKTISLTVDNIPIDLRVCLSLRIDSGKCGIMAVAKMSGYNKDKNMWGQYTMKNSIPMPDRKGMKALMEWIKEQAIAQCEWIPNPKSLHIYRR